MSNRSAAPARPRVQYAPVSPASGALPLRHHRDGETEFYLRRSRALVEQMRAAVAARRGNTPAHLRLHDAGKQAT